MGSTLLQLGFRPVLVWTPRVSITNLLSAANVLIRPWECFKTHGPVKNLFGSTATELQHGCVILRVRGDVVEVMTTTHSNHNCSHARRVELRPQRVGPVTAGSRIGLALRILFAGKHWVLTDWGTPHGCWGLGCILRISTKSFSSPTDDAHF